MSTKNKPTKTRNFESYQARVELRRSNAAVAFDNRPKRQRSRLDSKRAAIQAGY